MENKPVALVEQTCTAIKYVAGRHGAVARRVSLNLSINRADFRGYVRTATA